MNFWIIMCGSSSNSLCFKSGKRLKKKFILFIFLHNFEKLELINIMKVFCILQCFLLIKNINGYD